MLQVGLSFGGSALAIRGLGSQRLCCRNHQVLVIEPGLHLLHLCEAQLPVVVDEAGASPGALVEPSSQMAFIDAPAHLSGWQSAATLRIDLPSLRPVPLRLVCAQEPHVRVYGKFVRAVRVLKPMHIVIRLANPSIEEA